MEVAKSHSRKLIGGMWMVPEDLFTKACEETLSMGLSYQNLIKQMNALIKQKSIPNSITIFKKTTDNWNPSYSLTTGDMLVSVKFENVENKEYIISISGRSGTIIAKKFSDYSDFFDSVIDLISQESLSALSVNEVFNKK